MVPQDLLDILPFGCPFGAISFYRYIDYQLVDILTAARWCTAYWLLSHAHNFDQTPITQLSLFYDETFFWHYFVPSIRQEIITQIQAGHRIRFLSRFYVLEDKVELNLTKFDFKQSQVEISLQADSTSSSTPTNKSLPTSGVTVFGEPNSSPPEPSSLIPHPTSPSPSLSRTPREETPSTWNDSNVSYWNPTFSCSIHLIMTAWTVLHPPLWLVPLEPVPQAHLSRYIGVPKSSPFRKITQIFVSAESTSVIAISTIPEHHPPHQESTFGIHAFSEVDP